jgi:hypothetical protein
MSERNVYRLPPAFWRDHHARDLPEEGYSRLVRETKAAVYVELDAAALADLRSDAAYYSDAAMFERELSGLCASARATVRAIDRAAAQASDGVAA